MFGLFKDISEDVVNESEESAQPSAVAGEVILTVEGSFFVAGRGAIALGKIDSGPVRVGDKVVVGDDMSPIAITGIEASQQQVTEVQAGVTAGIVLDMEVKIPEGTVIKRVVTGG